MTVLLELFPGKLWYGTVLLVSALALNGCMLGPQYHEPAVESLAVWSVADEDLVQSNRPTDLLWWRRAFNDDELDLLITYALKQNLSLRSAGLQVLQSQQRLAIAVGNRFPQAQQITGSASRQRQTQTTFESYNVGFNLSWELDFWGRFSRQIESAAAELDASVANYDAAVVSLIAEIANNYLLVRTNQERREVARQNIDLQRQSLAIAQAKFNAGEVSELDVFQARSLLHDTEAQVFTYDTNVAQLTNSLAILLGLLPGALNDFLEATKPVPETDISIALGLPQDQIRRRPDLRAAERRLAAQSAQIGFAITDLYPHFTIGGTIGTSADTGGDLFTSGSEFWSIFGDFSWNIFNYGRLRNNVRLQDALFQQLLVDYRNTVLQAQNETENAIVDYINAHRQLLAYERANTAATSAVETASIQYQEGLINFNTVISNLSTKAQQQDLFAVTKGAVATNLVQVYRSLGGGWEMRADEDPVQLLSPEDIEELQQRTKFWEKSLPASY
ncbi:MAG: efflux transporter outer membrane subunit [Desulfofustis sp. PB-SRB1]|jgi:NodT family efflux transporter outer membrane factor (OMF) lipoprotein|nr:efflux transporter outer membrane subunit [Desulfofustis sp. PB-SRB1]MBM1002785.1 efflux transporter outer membrane subunit [Desulfofustis sp. PB-SRB1]